LNGEFVKQKACSNSYLKCFLLILSLAFLETSIAQQSATVNFILKGGQRPAKDLLNESGKKFEFSELLKKSQNYEDLSDLNPEPNRFWQNKSYPANDGYSKLPPEGSVVEFMYSEGRFADTGTEFTRVRDQKTKVEYLFSISRYAQSTMIRAALLRKLGYYLPSPKYYKKLKVKFSSPQVMTNYLDSMERDLSLDLLEKKWYSLVPGEVATIELISSTLEPIQADYFNFHFGYGLDPTNDEARGYIDLYSDHRAYRAQIIPVALIDIPESVNRYSPKFGMSFVGSVQINHMSAGAYSSSSVDDAKWILKRIAQLTEKDIDEIVSGDFYPSELTPLVRAKLVHRIYNALELFGLKELFRLNLPDLKYSSEKGLVVNGKVMRELTPGYPQRFAHGDRPSPFTDEDLLRFLKIKGLNTALNTAITELNKKLQLRDVADLVQNYQEDVIKDFIKHIRTKPGQPYVRGIDSFTGITSGFNVTANRQVTTGTYFGSSAPIQLVDNIGVSASIGTFTGFTGLEYTPVLATDIRYLRDYTHVRPLQIPVDLKQEGSLKEASDYPWSRLFVPKFMNQLGELVQVSTAEKNGLDEALKELRDGEVITVTDSIVTGAYAQASAGLDALMGVQPLSIVNSVQLGADLSKVVLSQLSFLRTANGIQVFVRKTNKNMFGVQLDFNYFINLLRIRQQSIAESTHTDAFIIDYEPTTSSQLDPSSDTPLVQKHFETRRKLQLTLADLFLRAKATKLYTHFKYNQFDLDHKLKTKERRSQFLFNKMTQMKESHTFKALWPKNPEFPDEDPKDSELILFSYKKGEYKGIDYLNFGLSIIDGLLGQKFKKTQINLADNSGNSSQVPFGEAYWRIVNTEGDLSKAITQQPNITIIQNIWSGWKIKNKDLVSLLNEVNQKYIGLGVRLIPPEDFAQAKSLDFYRISVSLSLLPGAQDKIKALLLQEGRPTTKIEKAKFLSRLFQKISEARGKKRPQDQGLYKDLLTLIGDGDFKKGYQVYDNECEKRRIENEAFNYPTSAWLYGQNYSCLTSWMTELIDLSRNYPQDKKAQIRWMTDVVYVLEKFIPIKALLSYIEEKNYLLVPNVFGFRDGDEDGDIEYISNALGTPEEEFPYANGLFNQFSRETGIVPTEVERTNGSFR
jgi:hypothetical protein